MLDYDKIHAMTFKEHKKYWPGYKKLASDLFFVLMLNFFILYQNETLITNVKQLIINTLCLFFIFFFWSWHKEHVQCRLARTVIHLFCWILFIAAFIFTILFLSIQLNAQRKWLLLIIDIIACLVAIKYYTLMKKENSNEIEDKALYY